MKRNEMYLGGHTRSAFSYQVNITGALRMQEAQLPYQTISFLYIVRILLTTKLKLGSELTSS